MTTTPETMVADPQKIIAELQRKSDELTAQQAATADILKVIASSPSNVQPVFEAIAERSNRLVNGLSTAVHSIVDDVQYLMAFTPISPAADAALKAFYPATLSTVIGGETIREGKIFRIADVELELVEPAMRDMARLRGWRSLVLVPLLREKRAIGLISVTRREPGSFAEHHVELLQSFADQAVIAIQNARLFDEVQAKTRDLEESLQQQTATADVLKIISRSAFDLDSVLGTLVESATRVCEAERGMVYLRKSDQLHMSANFGFSEELEAFSRANPFPMDGGSTTARTAASGVPVQTVDVLADETQGELALRYQQLGGHRCRLGVPLRRDGQTIGVFLLTRHEPRAFTNKQIEIVQTFADQAVIAIENARLFNETKEALERQTATAEILKVIASSPSDVQPVFEAIAESAKRLLGGHSSLVTRVGGGMVHLAAFTEGDDAERHPLQTVFPYALSVDRPHSNVAVTGIPLIFPDTETENYGIRDVARARGYRSLIVIPMFREGITIGTIGVTRRDPGPFTDNVIALLKTFADQAVIAIENARLFNETKEALERQTATADILKVIASSPSDVQPVFEAIAERSNRLVNGLSTAVFMLIGDMVHLAALTATNPAADAALKAMFPAPLSGMSWNTVVLRGEIYRIPDTDDVERLRDLARLRGYRSMLLVPLLHDGELIGLISQTRRDPGPFNDHHAQLLQTFADQAVIAISNVRLFQEVQKRTTELSASLDNLRTAQDRLVQTEKLASLGQLTAGIAHEIKNPLNFVNNFSALSAELTDELNDVLKPVVMDSTVRADVDELTGLLKDNLEKVVQHGKRADSIVKNMLLHSREGSGEQRAADINALLDESLNLAYHGARAEKPEFNITLRRDLDPDAGAIDVFPQEITRAFINLISNGFYAANIHKAENGDPDFEPVLGVATKNLGSHVEIRIRDNGTGIPAEVKEKIFNPFFTTKPAGEGTGLGLSMSHDIVVKQHGGRIEVDTQPGRFTEFTIVLPRQTIIRK